MEENVIEPTNEKNELDVVLVGEIVEEKPQEKLEEGLIDEDGIFSHPEKEELDRVRNVRKGIINELTKDGIPDNPKTIRLLNEVLTSHENSINSRASVRLKKQEISSVEMQRDQIVQILKNVRTSGEFIGVNEPSPLRVKEEKSIDVNLVPGQTSLVEEGNIADEILSKLNE